MTVLTPRRAERLATVLGMPGSSHGGETAAACRRAAAMVKQATLTWREILTPQLPRPAPKAPSARMPEPEIAAEHRLAPGPLNAVELRVVRGVRAMAAIGRRLSPRQADWRERLWLRELAT